MSVLLRLLRQFSAVIAKELAGDYAEDSAAQPGRLFFPKRVHDLGSLEPDAPDSLGLEFSRIAAARNKAAWRETAADSSVKILATHVSEQIGRAVVLERTILERLKSLR